jgi:hypothetical protein
MEKPKRARKRKQETAKVNLKPLKGPVLCCMRDEGRPLGIGRQGQVPNHRMLLRLNGRGGERDGKGGARLHQVRSGKTNASEPLMKCRNGRDVVETRVGLLPWDEVWGRPVCCPGGGRHKGGVSPDQALMRNVGTYRFDVKGELTSGRTTRGRVPMRSGGTDRCVVVMKPSNVGGAKASTCPAEARGQLERGGACG